jgi:glycosyltransferase involved in cell wall biosynthesis
LQGRPKNKYEVIVVNNASTDKTEQVARTFGVNVFNEPIRGIARARQRGFEMAKGEIIVSFDADSKAPPDWLSRIATAFQNNPRLVVIWGLYDLEGVKPHINFAVNLVNLFSAYILGCFIGTNMAIKKSAFKKTLGFDITLTYADEQDIGTKIAKFGPKQFIPSLRVMTSGRRYYKRGLVAGVEDYIFNYLRYRFQRPIKDHHFIAGSQHVKGAPSGKIFEPT